MSLRKLFKKKGTSTNYGSSAFSNRDVIAPLPPARETTTSGREATNPEKEAKDAQNVEDEASKASGNPTPDKPKISKGEPSREKKTVTDNVVEDKDGSFTSYGSNVVKFHPFWNSTIDYDLIPSSYPEANQWTPNAAAMFQILSAMSLLSINHRDLGKYHPEYNDYATGCYYAVIFYVQILRARRSAGLAEGEDSSFLRRFEREVKFENCHIAGPLVPFFYTLVGGEIKDARYGKFAPRIERESFKATMATVPSASGSWLLQPQVPYMLSILRMMIDRDMWARQILTRTFTQGQTDYCFLDAEDRFVPHSTEHNGHQNFQVWGRANNMAGANSDTVAFTTSASGLDFACQMDSSKLPAIGKFWWNSNLRHAINFMPLDYHNVGHGAAAGPAGITYDGTTAINNIDNFMCMPKSGSMTWFLDLATNAEKQCKIFDGSTTLASIPTMGGPTFAVIANIGVQGLATREYDAPAAISPVQDGTRYWYNNIYRRAFSSFKTSIAGVSREDTLQAMTFATNAGLPVHDAAAIPVGQSHTANAAGALPNSNIDNGAFRQGRFFVNPPEVKEDLFVNDDGAPLAHGVPMFRSFQSIVQSHYYLERMTGVN